MYTAVPTRKTRNMIDFVHGCATITFADHFAEALATLAWKCRMTIEHVYETN